jgi:hypothetical protein
MNTGTKKEEIDMTSLQRIGRASALGVSLLAAIGLANVRLEFPGAVPGPPAYAEISDTPPWGLAINHTDEWAAITLYRLPSCVPPTFNLMDFADVPAAFGCQLTVQGFEVWTAPPPDGQGPIQVRIWGLGAVPIYFVRWPELEAAIKDRVLTIVELQALPSLLIGYATFYTSDAHPAMTARPPPIHRPVPDFGERRVAGRQTIPVAGRDGRTRGTGEACENHFFVSYWAASDRIG